ncbi:MAG: GspH/FimT family pseudopilin [Gammaproteobacteria bacterium]|jgi:type IV fimbrial biogenesis protein FimT|nr:GspH/FimT family pseudopilin [Gammaproteobacteria bacterium]
MKKYSGFTLVELMITLFIVGILVAVGVPSMRTFMQNNQLIATTNELVSAIHVARSEALKLNKRVTICVSDNGKSCISSEKWALGWIVFVDANDDRVGTGVKCSAAADVNTDCLLRVHDAIDDPQLSVSGTYDSNSADIEWFTFTSRGVPKDTSAYQSGTFSICSFDSSNTVINSRAVVLSLSGRVRVSDNAAVSCPASP